MEGRLGKYVGLAVLIAFAASGPLHAFKAVERGEVFEIPRLGAPSQVRWDSYRVGAPEIPAGTGVDLFAARYGGKWHYQVNRATGTYHRIYGTGVELGVPISSRDTAEKLAREFVDKNLDVFSVGTKDLQAAHIEHALGKWSVIFEQTYEGLRVWDGRVDLVFGDGGRLFSMSSDTYPGVDISITPSVSLAAALSIAKNSISFDEKTDKVTDCELLVLPVETGAESVEYRLTYRLALKTAEPFGIWATWIDGNTGEILWRENHIRFADFSGFAEANIEWEGYCGTIHQDELMPNMWIDIIGVGPTYTDANGEFSLPAPDGSPRTIKSEFKGRWVNVDRADGEPDSKHTGTIVPDEYYEIDWRGQTYADFSEMDAYAFVDKVHGYVKNLDPEFTDCDYQMIAVVEQSPGLGSPCPCNARWDPDTESMAFCAYYNDGEYLCMNAARIPDIVYHEYGHAVSHFLYNGNPPDNSVEEGSSDFLANLVTGKSKLGVGFIELDCYDWMRNSDNDLQYPCSGEIHECGQVIAGFHWHVWKGVPGSFGVGKAVAAQTWHFGRKLGKPTSQPNQVYWTFVADDDDDNLGNGTPHYHKLCAAAEYHGFDCPALTPVTLTVNANYVGPDYPEGFSDPEANGIEVKIDGTPYDTPVSVEIDPMSTVTVSVKPREELQRNDAYFGRGSFDHWSDGGARAHQVTITSDTTFTVFLDPDLIMFPFEGNDVVCYVDTVLAHWASPHDTVMFEPGEYWFDPADTIHIVRPVVLLSRAGADSTRLWTSEGECFVYAYNVSDFRIGAVDSGFTFEAYNVQPPVPHLYAVQADLGCTDFVIAGNRFLNVFCGVGARRDTSFALVSNSFILPYMGTFFSDCDDIGIYSNYFDRVKAYSIYLQDSTAVVQIGGDLDRGNVFSRCYRTMEVPCPEQVIRVDAECNYWGVSTYSGIRSAMHDSYRLVDCVPWADSLLTQTYVPFDADSTRIEAPSGVTVCPAGDWDPLLITLKVRDSEGGKIKAMWCDDVETMWIAADPETLGACDGREVLFADMNTGDAGEVTEDLTAMSGCGFIEIRSIESVALSDTAVIETRSPDFNADRIVDLVDFGHFANLYLTEEPCGDLDYSGGVVDLVDFGCLAQHYFHACPEGLMGEGLMAGCMQALWMGEGNQSPARLGIPTQVVEPAEGGGDIRLGLYVDGYKPSEFETVELVMRWDLKPVEAVQWAGGGLYMIFADEAGLIHIVWETPESSGSYSGDLLGIATVKLVGQTGDAEPRLERLCGLTATGDVADLTGRLVPLTVEIDSEVRGVSSPVLEIGHSSSARTVTVRFGAPLSLGRQLRLDVYDVRGRLAGCGYDGLNDGLVKTMELALQGGVLRLGSPGMYFVRLSIDGRALTTQKVVLLK